MDVQNKIGQVVGKVLVTDDDVRFVANAGCAFGLRDLRNIIDILIKAGAAHKRTKDDDELAEVSAPVLVDAPAIARFLETHTWAETSAKFGLSVHTLRYLLKTAGVLVGQRKLGRPKKYKLEV